MKNRINFLLVMTAVLILAGAVRFYDLSRSAVRSDEISFLFRARQNQSLVELWKTPPWFNQIPLADSVPVVWARMTGQTVDEGVVRQPFALLGWITVAGCTAWMFRRRSAGAGLLFGVWLALLPYHVYQSREAYYYVLVMAFSAGMALRAADFMGRLKTGSVLKVREYAEWAVWTLLACMSHMSVWVVAGITWLLLLLAGLIGSQNVARKRHLLAMGCVALALGGCMIRWVLRALYEMKRAEANPSAHIGAAFGWVGPRVLTFFAGGSNAAGIGILAALLIAAVIVFWCSRGKPWRDDPLYGSIMAITFTGLLGSYAYIFFAGGGDKAKLSYFSANLPVFLAWAVMTIDRAVSSADRKKFVWNAVAAVVLAGLLVFPVLQVIKLDGKPIPYRKIQSWLDANLPKGSVAIVDRWYEPWNEMALYAPTNVFVTFTIPDEPYQVYRKYNWRDVTRQKFLDGQMQAFIRLTRNHEEQDGVWRWPEEYFTRHAVISNEAGLWLRRHGFAPMEDFYAANTNRLVIEIFYDTNEDAVARARREGRDVLRIYGDGWGYAKPGWQQGHFEDYRILMQAASLDLYNLKDIPLSGSLEISAATADKPKTVSVNGATTVFSSGRIRTWTVPLTIQPGKNKVPFTSPSVDPLFVLDIRWKSAQP